MHICKTEGANGSDKSVNRLENIDISYLVKERFNYVQTMTHKNLNIILERGR